jgi:hypothetical protein
LRVISATGRRAVARADAGEGLGRPLGLLRGRRPLDRPPAGEDPGLLVDLLLVDGQAHPQPAVAHLDPGQDGGGPIAQPGGGVLVELAGDLQVGAQAEQAQAGAQDDRGRERDPPPQTEPGEPPPRIEPPHRRA